MSPTPDLGELARDHTPARVLVGRAGPAYRTATSLRLREDHAAARDAVRAEVDLQRDFGSESIAGFGLFEVRTRAGSKGEYLLRPDLGRRLDDEARERLRSECPVSADLQVVIGDGLSATAVGTQAPGLLAELRTAATSRGWSFGRPFLVRYSRVGVMNDVGDLLNPTVVVLLIGERPGLATAESLSAYLAFRPRAGHTDADRNQISKIHARGVSLEEATRRVVTLADQFRREGCSGVTVKEEFTQVAVLPG
ncbi:MAG: ethanolamine ammonia-lyase subunit EutC [Planctomycetes bacterium]|nr:ethanolamine ammonia-lyase subunit EutC [Planctomycetota bacterium]